MGIDPSSKKIAAVMKYGDELTSHVWETKRKKWEPETCAEVHEWALSRFGVPNGIAFVEGPVVGRGGARPTIVQAFTAGSLMAALVSAGWQVEIVNVQTWKKAVIGRGNATKDEIRRHLELRLPLLWEVTCGDGDLADAAAILAFGAGDTRAFR